VHTAVEAQRAARNQALFRGVNEEIRAASEVAACGAETVHDFVCECASETCTTPVRLSLGDYDLVRRNPRRFVVAPGHEEAALEQVVQEGPRATVVEKLGPAGEVATQMGAQRLSEAS
jgi:hypothetical protein